MCSELSVRTSWTVCVVSVRVLNSSLCDRVDCDGLEVGQADLSCLAQRERLDRRQGQLLGLTLALGQLQALERLDTLNLVTQRTRLSDTNTSHTTKT